MVLKVFMYIIFLTSILFIDLPLQKSIGTIGKSVVFIIAPVFLAFFFIIDSKSINKLWKRSDIKLFFVYWFITLTVSSIFSTFYVLLSGDISTITGQSILAKLLKASTYNLIFAISYALFCYFFLKLRRDIVHRSVIISFLFLSIVGIIEIYDKNLLTYFHAADVDYQRLRLLTSEPSQAGLLYVIFAILTIGLTFGVERLLYFAIFTPIFLMIQSKGAILLFFISYIMIVLFSYRHVLNLRVLLFSVIILIFGIFSIINYFLPSLLIDVERFTSFATRSSGFIAAILTLIYYPVGMGYGTYINLAPEILIKSVELLKEFIPYINDYEVYEIATSGENVGYKAGILSQIMFNGWFAVLFFAILFISTFKKIKYLDKRQQFIFRWLLLYIFLEILLAVDIEVMYAYLIPIAYVNTYMYNIFKQEGK